MKHCKSLLVVCLLSVFSPSCTALAQQGMHEFIIEGNINGMGKDSLLAFISHFAADGKRKVLDTLITVADQDRFVLRGRVAKPTFAWMQVGGVKSRKSFSLFLERGNIKVKGNADALDQLEVSGTTTNDEWMKTRRFTNSVYSRINRLRNEIKNHAESSVEYKLMLSQLQQKFDSLQQYEINFIKANPGSFVSGNFLYVKQDKLPLDELEQLYNLLTEDVKQYDMIAMIPAKIAARRSVALGNLAPDFTSTDTSGRTVKFADYRGKYVLLEFWASWCIPCRKESPNLVRLFQKFDDKEFTILQYSLDEKDAGEKWREAIRKDRLVQWTHISDLAGLHSNVAKLYGVQPIPDNFLIDPSGRIIARGLQGEALEQKLKELFPKNNH